MKPTTSLKVALFSSISSGFLIALTIDGIMRNFSTAFVMLAGICTIYNLINAFAYGRHVYKHLSKNHEWTKP